MMRKRSRAGLGLFAALGFALLLPAGGSAQQRDDTGSANDDASPAAAGDGETGRDADSVEEIVVIGNKRGDPIDLDARYEELLRARIIDDYEQIISDAAEEEWRKSLPESVEGPSRIRWGYDAQSEAKMRRGMELTDLPMDPQKPATLISIQF